MSDDASKPADGDSSDVPVTIQAKGWRPIAAGVSVLDSPRVSGLADHYAAHHEVAKSEMLRYVQQQLDMPAKD